MVVLSSSTSRYFFQWFGVKHLEFLEDCKINYHLSTGSSVVGLNNNTQSEQLQIGLSDLCLWLTILPSYISDGKLPGWARRYSVQSKGGDLTSTSLQVWGGRRGLHLSLPPSLILQPVSCSNCFIVRPQTSPPYYQFEPQH